MSASLLLEPPPHFADPRLEPDFQSELWPLCNGQPAPPPDAPDLHDRRCIEFLAAFYTLNVLNSRLAAARKRRDSKKVIKTARDAIHAASAALEKLEDRYAPIGFFGEPIMEGIWHRDIIFVRPQLPRIYGKGSSASSYVAIPGLGEIPVSELQGPITVRRWEYGKMDL